MTKRKLTIRQSSSVNRRHQKSLLHLQQATSPETETDLGAGQSGLLVALYGVEAEVEPELESGAESGKGIRYRCKLRQNLGVIVVGDRVIWRRSKDNAGIIEAVIPRRTLLSRPAREGHLKAIAANIDQVFIVVAPQPKPAVTLLDSYLVAIETLKLKPVIVFNKIELLTAAEKPGYDRWSAIYRQLAYPFVEVSATRQHGLDDLKTLLQQRTSVFVGQSGVGKSSLLRCLLPEDALKVGASTLHGHGLHTTTTARLYHLPSGGDVIDSPGVRDFILWNMMPREIAAGFIEFHDYLGQCRFRDCDHLHSPDCGLQTGIQEGKISVQRYTSYQRVVEFLATLKRS